MELGICNQELGPKDEDAKTIDRNLMMRKDQKVG